MPREARGLDFYHSRPTGCQSPAVRLAKAIPIVGGGIVQAELLGRAGKVHTVGRRKAGLETGLTSAGDGEVVKNTAAVIVQHDEDQGRIDCLVEGQGVQVVQCREVA